MFYCDSGSFFVDSISKLARALFHSKQDIAFSSLPLLELQWNKLLYSDNLLQQYNLNLNFSDLPPNQYSASFQLIKKTSMTLDFYQEYLSLCSVECLLNDDLSSFDTPAVFIEHRHDQAIFSLLCKKYRLQAFEDFSQYRFFPQSYAGIPSSFVKLPDDNIHFYYSTGYYHSSSDLKSPFLLFHTRSLFQPIYMLKLFLLYFLYKLGFKQIIVK